MKVQEARDTSSQYHTKKNDDTLKYILHKIRGHADEGLYLYAEYLTIPVDIRSQLKELGYTLEVHVEAHSSKIDAIPDPDRGQFWSISWKSE